MTISDEQTRLQLIRSILHEQPLPVQRSAGEVNLVVDANDADDCAVYDFPGNLSIENAKRDLKVFARLRSLFHTLQIAFLIT